MTSTEPAARLKELIDEMDGLVRAITAEARSATYSRMRSVHYPSDAFNAADRWVDQAEKSAHWPKRWVPIESMCPATVTGVGSGEGHESRPGIMACTRLVGHRDIRCGSKSGHTWGPERYSKERAMSAANRVATEEWAAFAGLTDAVSVAS